MEAVDGTRDLGEREVETLDSGVQEARLFLLDPRLQQADEFILGEMHRCELEGGLGQ